MKLEKLDVKVLDVAEKPMIKIEKLVRNEGKRPHEVYYRDRLTMGKVAIWESKYFPGHSAPGMTKKEKVKYNTRKGEEETENNRYQSVAVIPNDEDWFKGDNDGSTGMERLSAACAVYYQVEEGVYAENLKEFIEHLKGRDNRYGCGTCSYRKTIELVEQTSSGITDDNDNRCNVCSLMDRSVDDEYREVIDTRGDEIGDVNPKRVKESCFSDGLELGIPCPWHDKEYYRSNGMGWYSENPKPFFPIKSVVIEGEVKYVVEFDNFMVDITNAFHRQKKEKINSLLELFKDYRKGLDRNLAELQIDTLLKKKTLMEGVKAEVKERFLKLKGGE